MSNVYVRFALAILAGAIAIGTGIAVIVGVN